MRWPGGSGMAAQFALPAHRTLLLGQRGVLTHSAWAAETLREGHRLGEAGVLCEKIDDAVIEDGRERAAERLADRLAANGRRRARQEYDWRVISGQLSRLYRELAGNRRQVK